MRGQCGQCGGPNLWASTRSLRFHYREVRPRPIHDPPEPPKPPPMAPPIHLNRSLPRLDKGDEQWNGSYILTCPGWNSGSPVNCDAVMHTSWAPYPAQMDCYPHSCRSSAEPLVLPVPSFLHPSPFTLHSSPWQSHPPPSIHPQSLLPFHSPSTSPNPTNRATSRHHFPSLLLPAFCSFLPYLPYSVALLLSCFRLLMSVTTSL